MHIGTVSSAAEYPFTWSPVGMSDQDEVEAITERIEMLRLLANARGWQQVFGVTRDQVVAWLSEAEQLALRGDEPAAEILVTRVVRALEEPRP
jgi:hypothetical protein